ncbi:MAG: sugar transferase [Chloroflexota bacterium]
MDVVLSSVALAILSPWLLLIALLIKLDSPGPVIFAQERMGYDRRRRRPRSFVMFKFRSMAKNCDQATHQRLVRDWIRNRKGSSHPGQRGEMTKPTQDPRVTRIGRALRRASLDELPQLWNVLTGDMSLVGPRPVPLYEVAEYQDWHKQRLQVAPGITCLWQIKGRGLSSVDEMVRMDLEYIEQRSLWLDLKILLLTIPVIVTGRGAA